MIERFEAFHKNIASAHKNIGKLKSHQMNKYGLKAANVMCLYYLGKHKNGLTPSQLCELCCEDKAGISKSLALLKEKNCIKAVNDEGKVYRIKFRITDTGIAIYEKISEFIVNTVDKIGSGLTDEEREIFYRVLDKIVLNLDKYYDELKSKED